MSSKEKPEQYPLDPDALTYAAAGALINIIGRSRVTLTGNSNKGPIETIRVSSNIPKNTDSEELVVETVIPLISGATK